MMRKLMLAGLFGSVLATQALANPTTQVITVYISCFRGPITEVVWDHPRPIFIDSLMEAGYSLETAQAIGERTCRDKSLVGNPEGLKAEARRLIAEVPRDGN